jgi:hypothetical protein
VEETKLVELVRELVEEELLVEEENDPLVEEKAELLVAEEEGEDVLPVVVEEEEEEEGRDELELVEGVELNEAKYIPAPASTSMMITMTPIIDLEIAALLEAIKRNSLGSRRCP